MIRDGYYSASRIKTLQDCQKLFYRKYILDSLPEEEEQSPWGLLGDALHKMLEQWRKDPSIQPRGMIGMFDKYWTLGRDHFLFKEGCRIIWNLDRKKLVNGELISTEYPFETEVRGYPIKGVIDKIEKIDDDTLLVTDYKSNKTVEAKKYIHQLAIYDMVVAKDFPEYKRVHELYYLRHNKPVKFEFNQQSHDKIIQIFENADSLIKERGKNEALWPKLRKRESMCMYCPLEKECWK